MLNLLIKDALKDTPVVLLHGPRQSGKTTLVSDIGSKKHRNKRLVKTPKIHLSDTGLLCALSGFSKVQLINDRETMGRITESFIVNELLKLATWYDDDLQFFHYRDKDQYEVDLVLQDSNGDLIGIEVKLAASVKESDFKGLRRFRSQCPTKFIGGYLRERTLSFGEGIKAVPIQALWV